MLGSYPTPNAKMRAPALLADETSERMSFSSVLPTVGWPSVKNSTYFGRFLSEHWPRAVVRASSMFVPPRAAIRSM